MIAEFLQKYNLTVSKVFKLLGFGVVIFIVGSIIYWYFGPTISPRYSTGNYTSPYSSPPSSRSYSSQGLDISAESAEIPSSFSLGAAAPSSGFSLKNLLPIPPPEPINDTTMGSDAEQFEVTEYGGLIETTDFDKTCDKIVDLKSRDYVIFENAVKREHRCNYSFKVKRDKVAEVLAIIKNLKPKELIENTYTIKKQIENFTSEMEILNNKKASIEETLRTAILAYDQIADVATKSQNVDSLSRIIDSKIRIIERLTQERVNVSAQLDRLARAKAEELDRLDYTYFRIDVIDKKYLDWKNIKDSWRDAIQNFFPKVNQVLQDITINLVSWLAVILKYALYLIILAVLGKFIWRMIKRIWQS